MASQVGGETQDTQDVEYDYRGAIAPHDPRLYRYDLVPESVGTFRDVSVRELEAFHESGYLVVRKGFAAERIEAALAALLDLIEGVSPEFGGVQFELWARDRLQAMSLAEKQDAVRKMMSSVPYDERLQALAFDPDLLGVVHRLLGGEPKIYQDMALFKPPGGGTEKPWHQDKAYFDVALDEPVIGVWIALDEARPDNGCMHIIPGSHREGPMTHFWRRDWQICDADVQVQRDVMVPLPPGGVLLFDGLLHHGTPSNRSNERRRSLQFHYTTADVRRVAENDRLGVFGSEGKNVSC
jgi:phytanoyl-CoA hydroxylase